jgi:EF hand
MTQTSKGTSNGKGMNIGVLFNRQKTGNRWVKSGPGITWCILLAAILLIVPAMGFAADDSDSDKMSPEERFEADDADGDGRVSADEFSGPSEHFSDIDQDGDGYIDSDEHPRGSRGGEHSGGSRGEGPGGGGPRS